LVRVITTVEWIMDGGGSFKDLAVVLHLNKHKEKV
jgi:hypothetical protein